MNILTTIFFANYFTVNLNCLKRTKKFLMSRTRRGFIQNKGMCDRCVRVELKDVIVGCNAYAFFLFQIPQGKSKGFNDL